MPSYRPVPSGRSPTVSGSRCVRLKGLTSCLERREANPWSVTALYCTWAEAGSASGMLISTATFRRGIGIEISDSDAPDGAEVLAIEALLKKRDAKENPWRPSALPAVWHQPH